MNDLDGGRPVPSAKWPRLSWPHQVALGLVLVLIGLFALRQVSSPDIGFHLRAGNYILSGNGWPPNDPFTYTVTDHAYLDTSWGYQVLLALVERMRETPFPNFLESPIEGES